MTEDTLRRKKVTADFAGGALSSDGGLVLLRAAERRLEALAGCIQEWRDPVGWSTRFRRCCAFAPAPPGAGPRAAGEAADLNSTVAPEGAVRHRHLVRPPATVRQDGGHDLRAPRRRSAPERRGEEQVVLELVGRLPAPPVVVRHSPSRPRSAPDPNTESRHKGTCIRPRPRTRRSPPPPRRRCAPRRGEGPPAPFSSQASSVTWASSPNCGGSVEAGVRSSTSRNGASSARVHRSLNSSAGPARRRRPRPRTRRSPQEPRLRCAPRARRTASSFSSQMSSVTWASSPNCRIRS